MKIAFTSHGDDQQAAMDSRFGRADYFVIYDQENDSWECLSNTQNLEAAHGAGIQAAQSVAKTGVSVLITGHVGPKAFKVLEAAKIKMYSIGARTCTVEEALSAFLASSLTAIAVPNALESKK